MHYGWRKSTCWVAVGAALAAQIHAQTQAPTFRSGTQVVEVDVRVFDSHGHFVTDLKPEDFEIKEDGAVQPITAATVVGAELSNLEPNASLEGEPQPSNRTAAAPDRGTAEPASPSTFLFLFDTPHLSPAGLNRSRAAVVDFVHARMQQGDLAGVVANGTMVGNRLTTDREELGRDLESIKMPGEVAALQRTMKFEVPRFSDEYEAYMIAERDDPEALGKAVRRGCEDDQQLCPNMEALVKSKAQAIDGELHDAARLTVTAVRALSHGLARMAGTKSIVFVSEGFMLWHVKDELRDAIGEANRAGAHVYAIDVRGLNKGHASDLLFANQEDRPEDGLKFDQQVDGPNSLAIGTGGMFIENQNDLGRVLDAIQRDAGTYYVIGYTPTNQRFDGKYRTISVSVKRPDVKVRARRGYLAIEPAKLLKAVATSPAAAPTPSLPPVAGAPEETPAIAGIPASAAPAAPSPANTAAEAAAVRMRIDNGGLVAALRGNDATADTDPASLGWAAYQKGDVETARRELTEATHHPETHPWAYYVLGLCHLALNEYPGAASSWEYVREKVPTFEPVYFNLADAYYLQNDLAKSLAVLASAEKRWPKDAEIFNAEGVIQIHSGALVDAIASFGRATKLAPKDPMSFFNLASANHAAALRLRELSASRTAQLQETPNDRRLVQSTNGRGLLGTALWRRDEAIKAYRRVIALKGDYVAQAKKGLAALQAK